MTEEQEAQYVQKKLEELIPSIIDDILSFANDYDAAENVESVFKWDVSDIFYNYFFVGNSLNVGGPNGDDPKQIDIYNEDSLKSLKVYQDLNQFFSIEADEVDYNSVLPEFIAGRVIFSVVTTESIGIL